MRWILVLAMWLWPAAALAGAWARGEGNVYLSVTAEAPVSSLGQSMPELSFYGEYGLRSWLTGGIKLFDGTGGQTDEAYAFATAHLGRDRALKIGLTLGGGVDRPDGQDDYRGLGLIGGHLGYGLPNGWLSLDAQAIWRINLYPPFELPDPEYKADFTFGHRFTPRLSAIAQLQAGQPAAGQPYL